LELLPAFIVVNWQVIFAISSIYILSNAKIQIAPELYNQNQ
jgi:hypothetical protein